VSASAGGIVLAKHPLVAQAGQAVLARGGNAFDALVAMGFAAGVAEPAMSGIGGGALQVVYATGRGDTGVVEAPVVAPRGADLAAFAVETDRSGPSLFGLAAPPDRAHEVGHRAVAVPGVLAGLCRTLERGGRMALGDVMRPAIELARQGVPLRWADVVQVARCAADLRGNAAAAAIFLREGAVPRAASQPPMTPGDRWVQADLARTLARIAAEGPEVFYRGEIAQRIDADMRRHGGLLRLDDLSAYTARESEATEGRYRGVTVATGPDRTCLDALALLEPFDLAGAGPGSVAATHLVAEACLRVHSRFLRFVSEPGAGGGDGAPPGSRPPAGGARDRLDPARATTHGLFPDEAPAAAGGSGHTTAYAAVDGGGTWVCALATLGYAFGACVVVPETGVLLNDQMLGFNFAPGTRTSVGPGRPRPIPGWPVIGLEGRTPRFCVAVPGGARTVCALVQVCVNLMDFDLPIAEALAAPRIDVGATPGARYRLFVAPTLPEPVRAGLARVGHDVAVLERSVFSPDGSPYAFAAPGGLERRAGRLAGANDPEVPGAVLAAASSPAP
jgi:gamma-glutamyltranspeptidase/glutathione hydrolase